MSILAIDTSNETLGVAIHDGAKTIAAYIANSKTKHSKRLMPVINQLMQDANMTPQDLTRIVVAKGPGSYTGVRIGLSTAKMMAWTLQIPVIGISSLETLALHAITQPELICPFFDARRGLVYTGLYQRSDAHQAKLIKDEQNVLMEDWLYELRELNQSILFLSPDLALYRDLIQSILGEKAIFPMEPFHHPSPALLAVAGSERAEDPVHQLTPNYLRLVEAEAKWLAKQKEHSNE
ncbi:tRNA (adenosine(37)-N6)-threonylcarbamoyltransferase complex dimerization subunit type 1 TsaB [Paraliobacillus ryukyuensis]|uniref:tRNA (adenosine(37)-N6)-threonylcarbamoyltransferase complex dimerization subunit type 1 TsaB n=1 Tax=Paraliobacillus ryukyuensis TaxID=200904 RepID=UPI0009A9010D|nr:tRNA (adenosine(37)-N6)-threonylcarbamoyltransferase complex dimerization subunit type 1 TsaB [Paraliobacillus ryukyuensis]